MNKLCLLFFLVWGGVNAQTFGSQQIISTEGDGPWAVFAMDLDGDGLKDVMTANSFSNDLLWFKNLGNGLFGEKQVIGTLEFPLDIYAADMDGDDDRDILSLSPVDNSIVWYKNLDGLGTFGPQQIIGTDALFAITIRAADLDGDNDMDVISGTDSSGLAWYENVDNGDFGPKIPINASLPNARSVMAVDMDGDMDLDVVSSSSGSVTVSWYENLDGNGTFGPLRVIAGSAPTVSKVYAIDLDGDLDNDVLATTNSLEKVAWFENLDGLGNFGSENIISLEAESVTTLFATDLDNDNDIDVLYSSTPDSQQATSEVLWSANLDGLGSFSPKQVIDSSLKLVRSVFAADMDNDGDMDVLSASQNDDKITWYENLTILNVSDLEALGIKMYPNPVKAVLVIESPVPLKKVTLFSVLGNKLLEATKDLNEISLASLPSGLLVVEIETEKGKMIQKVVKE
ncbi:MAG: T9SS type A sorting domain-containing protein [Flavobacteriaceae bacterium]